MMERIGEVLISLRLQRQPRPQVHLQRVLQVQLQAPPLVRQARVLVPQAHQAQQPVHQVQQPQLAVRQVRQFNI